MVLYAESLLIMLYSIYLKHQTKVGDYVMFRANTGTRFKVAGVEYRLMNDDSIEAVVADPRGVSRAI